MSLVKQRCLAIRNTQDRKALLQWLPLVAELDP